MVKQIETDLVLGITSAWENPELKSNTLSTVRSNLMTAELEVLYENPDETQFESIVRIWNWSVDSG